MATRYFLILTVLKIWSLSCAEMITLCVTSNTSCTINCEQHSNQIVKLKDLSSVVNKKSNITEIEAFLCSALYTGDEIPILNFTNLLSVTITGIVGTELNCHNKECTGLYFKNVRKISLNSMTLNGCKFLLDSGTVTVYRLLLSAAVYIAHSANISINSVLIQGSYGSGLVLLNNSGYINISDSNFKKNCVSEDGSGLNIQAAANQRSVYQIQNCTFSYSCAIQDTGNTFMMRRRGGGIRIYLTQQTANISLTIIRCKFTNNTALNLYLFSENYSLRVSFNECQFDNDIANENISFSKKMCIVNPSIVFKSCNFFEVNSAPRLYGGRVYLNTTSTNLDGANNITLNISVTESSSLSSDTLLPSNLPCMNFSNDSNQALHSIVKFYVTLRSISATTHKLFANESILTFYPGISSTDKELKLYLKDLKNNKAFLFQKNVLFQVKVANGPISVINSNDVIATSNKIKLNGHTNSTGKVTLCLNDFAICNSFNVTLQCCPPGYIYNNLSCHCGDWKEGKKNYYLGIKRCNKYEYKARLIHGYWAGYIHVTQQNNCNVSFRTSNCPVGYCNNTGNLTYKLPYEKNQLNEIVCSHNRTGVICANCSASTSVFYGDYQCFKEKTHLCKAGPVFFILSQLVPLTALFLTLIVFDIELTTGALNGFLFYMQTFSTQTITAYGFIRFPKVTRILLEILKFVVGAFNLQYFHFRAASFCLHRGATYLDVLAWDYIKVVYALLLIVLTVIIMNLRCYRINRCLQKLNGRNVHYSQSIIHGLSGLLIMCYSKTTTISLKLLAPEWLSDENGVDREQVRVFYNGEMKYFDHNHLKYAIPALVMFILITLLPPMLLLTYPLCYKVLALFRLEESKFATLLCTVIPLEKIRPFFDSFQGAFKDNHRYFAGLYFLYRMLPLLLLVLQSNLANFYMYLEMLLILMLALHIWVQPYKEKRHNQFDSFIFLLLLTINGISFYNYHSQHTPHIYHWSIKSLTIFTSTIQILLAYMPVVIIAVGIMHKRFKVRALLQYVRANFKRQSQPIEDLTLSMIDEGRGMDYQKLHK